MSYGDTQCGHGCHLLTWPAPKLRLAAGGIRALMVPLGQLGHEQKRQLGSLPSASLHHSSLALSLSESYTGNPDNRDLWIRAWA